MYFDVFFVSCMHLNLFIIPDYLDTDSQVCIHVYDRPFVINVVYSVDGFLDIYI